jgi:exopolysaccharide biosynthesis WecB/TagA/CpsF family protein
MAHYSLGAILLERGLITPTQLDSALKQQSQQAAIVGWQLLGEVLVESGAITRRSLADALDEQTRLIEAEFFSSRPHPATQSLVKRTIDLVGSLFGLILALALFPVIAIAIYLDTPGPILVTQLRMGLHGKQFKLWRFRTSDPNSEPYRLKISEANGEKLFNARKDPQVTRIGKILRHFYLDELPQFFNVLKGEMSLVGTRPPTLDETKLYSAQDWQRLAVKPGMTGLWQISPQKYDLKFEQVLALDLSYIRNWRYYSDLRVLLATAVYILSGPPSTQPKAMRFAVERKKVGILNIPIDNLSIRELLEQLKSGVLVTPNVDHLMKLQRDAEFYRTYALADYRVCDSQILMYAARLLGTPLKEKISGSDFFPAFCDYHRHNPDITIFLMGGAPGVADRARARLNKKAGRELIIGSHSPSFGFERNEQECQEIIELINQSKATVLAIGVGAPKQEKWIYKYKDQLTHVKIFMAIGATIDFEAGVIKRAPKWMSKLGIEWMFRIAADPKRLWKRYLIEDLPFFWLLLKQKLGFYTCPFAGSCSWLSPAQSVSGNVRKAKI